MAYSPVRISYTTKKYEIFPLSSIHLAKADIVLVTKGITNK